MKKNGGKRKKREIPKDLQSLQSLFQVVEKGKTMWEATFDAIQDPVLIINKDYRIERANIASGEQASLPISEMIGQHCYEVLAGRKAICPHCPLEKTIQKRTPHRVEINRFRGKADFYVNSYPLSLADDSLKVVHHYRDMTGQKKLQKQLIQSEKLAAIGMLAGGVAHEINNPLGGILAFTQLLQSELPQDSPSQEDLKEIEEAAKRCKKIVEELLSFSRPGGQFEDSPQDVNQLLERILPLLKLNLRASRVSIKTLYGERLPKILGEATRLQQVFLNLIQNAAEAMKENGGEITIRTGLLSGNEEIFVEVEDSGPGIPSEMLGSIFDPFFTTKGLKGTGLGLAICDSIIHDHLGRIEVRSEMGKGSLFRVVLPIVREEKS